MQSMHILNSLDFIASVITIWIDNINKSIKKVSQTDSASASGWVQKSNFSNSDDEIVKMTTA